MSIFRPYRRRHGVSIFKLQHGSYAVATLTPIMPFQKRNVSRGSKMSITISNIRTELISDFAAGRLDAEDAQVIQEAIDHDEVIATAVSDARRIDPRMKLWLATSTVGAPASDAGRTPAARLQ